MQFAIAGSHNHHIDLVISVSLGSPEEKVDAAAESEDGSILAVEMLGPQKKRKEIKLTLHQHYSSARG